MGGRAQLQSERAYSSNMKTGIGVMGGLIVM